MRPSRPDWQAMQVQALGSARRRPSGILSPHSTQWEAPSPAGMRARAVSTPSAMVSSIWSKTAPSCAHPVAIFVSDFYAPNVVSRIALGRSKRRLIWRALRCGPLVDRCVLRHPRPPGGNSAASGKVWEPRCPQASANSASEPMFCFVLDDMMVSQFSKRPRLTGVASAGSGRAKSRALGSTKAHGAGVAKRAAQRGRGRRSLGRARNPGIFRYFLPARRRAHLGSLRGLAASVRLGPVVAASQWVGSCLSGPLRPQTRPTPTDSGRLRFA
jgi:hypothetical protein